METTVLFVVTLLAVAATVYAHYRLPAHTPNMRQLRVGRIVLISTGLAFGWVAARVYGMATELNVIMVFVAGFGLIHVPAACVLYIKGLRPEG